MRNALCHSTLLKTTTNKRGLLICCNIRHELFSEPCHQEGPQAQLLGSRLCFQPALSSQSTEVVPAPKYLCLWFQFAAPSSCQLLINPLSQPLLSAKPWHAASCCMSVPPVVPEAAPHAPSSALLPAAGQPQQGRWRGHTEPHCEPASLKCKQIQEEH